MCRDLVDAACAYDKVISNIYIYINNDDNHINININITIMKVVRVVSV